MNLTIRSHHTAVFDDLREHAEKKLSRLDRYLPRVDHVVIEVKHEETRAAAHRYGVQVTVHAAGSILRAEERAADPKGALDAAADAVARQARRHTKRLHDRHRSTAAKEYASAVANPPASPEPVDDEDADYILGKVVRVKQFDARPIPPDEALAQMDLLGHDFFLFLDPATDDYALIYKRNDGDYGMLVPRRA